MDEPFDEVTAAALRARRGDAAAAAEFVRRTQADVWRFCAHIDSPAAADDLSQETYARAFAALHRFEGRASARTWLLGIARHTCADAVRTAVRDRALRAVLAVVSPAAPEPDPAGGVVTRDLLAGLDTERREAFVLTQLVGLSYAETADVCGCPIGTIRSRVARARDDLITAAGASGSRRTG